MSVIRLLIITLLFFHSYAAQASSNTVTLLQNKSYTLPSAGNPDAALNFMLGNWVVHGQSRQQDGSYHREAPTRLSVSRMFQTGASMGVMFHGSPSAQTNGTAGAGFEYYRMFVYHRDSRSWRGVGHNSRGIRKWLEGHIEGESFYFDQRDERSQQAKSFVRFSFINISENSHQVRVDFTPDGGLSWIKGTYLMDVVRAP